MLLYLLTFIDINFTLHWFRLIHIGIAGIDYAKSKIGKTSNQQMEVARGTC